MKLYAIYATETDPYLPGSMTKTYNQYLKGCLRPLSRN